MDVNAQRGPGRPGMASRFTEQPTHAPQEGWPGRTRRVIADQPTHAPQEGWPGRTRRVTEQPTMQSIQKVPRTPCVLTSRGWGRRMGDTGSQPRGMTAGVTHQLDSPPHVQVMMGQMRLTLY